MMFNNFDYAATNALFVLPLLVVLLIAPFAPGSVLAVRLGRRAALIRAGAVTAYLAAVLALVFLPIPADPAAYCAAGGETGGFSFVPFRWVGGVIGFMENQGQRLTLQGFLHNEAIYQAITNVGLFLPLGVALRLLSGIRFPVALAAIVGLSLAIEVIQGSAMLGLLPCAHRLGDIDDLMLNVLGGALGWIVAAYLRPARAVRRGHRLVAFAIDLAVVEAALIVLNAAAGPFRPAPFAGAFVITATLLVVMPAAVSGGVTLGKAMTGIRLVARGGGRLPPWRLVVRYALLFGVPAALFLWPQLLLPPETNDVTAGKAIVFGVQSALLVLLGPVMMLVRKDARGLHDIVSGSDHRPLDVGRSRAPPAAAPG
ncbi:MAG: VanZ family protein [Bauldia sp.]|nr:VanZ family protein [Bauldia sp.]